MNTIGHRVKVLRNSLGLTQCAFGEKIEVAQTYLSQIEKGDRDVTDKIFKLICLQSWNGKNVNEEWLRSGTGDMFVKDNLENQLMTWATQVIKNDSKDFQRRFVTMLSQLDEKEWLLLEKMALKIQAEQSKNKGTNKQEKATKNSK